MNAKDLARKPDGQLKTHIFPMWTRATPIMDMVRMWMRREPAPHQEPTSSECKTCLPDNKLPAALEAAGLPKEKVDAILALRFRQHQGLATDDNIDQELQQIINPKVSK